MNPSRSIHFISGLPRAGSTLLANILLQNPRLHATHTSGLHDVLFSIRNGWDKQIEHRAHPDEAAKRAVLSAVLNAYHQTDRPVVLDRGRGWLSLLEMAEWIMGRRGKVLVPVRDLVEILASFETLHRANSRWTQTGPEPSNYFAYQTVAGRCDTLMKANEVVGLALNRLVDALQRGLRDRIHFVHFSELTTHPSETIANIYDFLGESPFKHDFDRVDQVTQEDDSVHNIKGLHDIRSKVEPVRLRALETLGPAVCDRYKGPYIWSLNHAR